MIFASIVAVYCGVLSLGIMVSGQPAFCTEDSQCSSGFYCEETVHACHECVRCGDLKRESPLPLDVCIKSVLDCGVCLKGFVEDLRLDRACILKGHIANDASSSNLLPPYAWILIVLSLIVVLTMIAIYIFKKDTLFSYICKIRTSTHASVHSRCTNNGISSAPPPSSNDPPPPYNPYYAPVRSVSPSETSEHNAVPEDSSAPFIKRTPAPPGAAAHSARESAGNQAAHPFSNPSYVRGPAQGFGLVEEVEPVSTFLPHDEDTMESLWTPNESVNNNVNGNLAEIATLPATPVDVAGSVASVARRTADSGPPAKVARLREDSNNNNNRGRESNSSGTRSPRSPSPSPSPAPQHSLVINVVTNINNLEQRNSVHMPKH